MPSILQTVDTTTRTETVLTGDGPVRGVVQCGMQCFLGIPYAAPPTGPLRWRPPTAPTPWTAVLDAVAFGDVCAQDTSCFPGFGHASSTEDCLYLNVFTPDSPAAGPRPVMVWIPGGGLFIGGSTGYDPTALVTDGDVVVVSLNYRLNVFGFFSHPAINAEGHEAGNYGLMDQQLALRWVQENINAFGGDPNRVTIFGESAGAQSVGVHLGSPRSAGLFHRAIMQSGATTPVIDLPTLSATEEVGIALAKAAGCQEQTPEWLRAIPTADLLAANAMPPGVFGTGQFQIGFVEDGIVVPVGMRQRFVTGEFNKVPVINGVNRDEFTWFMAMSELVTGQSLEGAPYELVVGPMLGEIASWGLLGARVPEASHPELLERYPLGGRPGVSNAVAAVISDGLISVIARTTTLIQAHVPQTYAYEFDVPDAPVPWQDVSFAYLSGHTQELQFLFPAFRGGGGHSRPLTEAQQALASQLVRYWTNFAHHADPSVGLDHHAPEQPRWSPYDPEQDNAMLLALPEPVEVEGWRTRHHVEFWDRHYTGN